MSSYITAIFILGFSALLVSIFPLHYLRIKANDIIQDKFYNPGLYNDYIHIYLCQKENLVSQRFIIFTKICLLLTIYGMSLFLIGLLFHALSIFFNGEDVYELLPIIYEFYPLNITIIYMVIDLVLIKIIINHYYLRNYKNTINFNFFDIFLPFYKYYIRLYYYSNESQKNQAQLKSFFIITLLGKTLILVLWVIFLLSFII